MSARKAQRRAKAPPALLVNVMELCAQDGVKLAFNKAWKAARAEDLKAITLQDFLAQFIVAMRAEVDHCAAQIEAGVKP